MGDVTETETQTMYHHTIRWLVVKDTMCLTYLPLHSTTYGAIPAPTYVRVGRYTLIPVLLHMQYYGM